MNQMQELYDQTMMRLNWRLNLIRDRLAAGEWGVGDMMFPITQEDRLMWETELQSIEHELARIEVQSLMVFSYYSPRRQTSTVCMTSLVQPFSMIEYHIEGGEFVLISSPYKGIGFTWKATK